MKISAGSHSLQLMLNILSDTIKDYREYSLYLAEKPRRKITLEFLQNGEDAERQLFEHPFWLADMLEYVNAKTDVDSFRALIKNKAKHFVRSHE